MSSAESQTELTESRRENTEDPALTSPPSSPDPLEGSDPKSSRKREREISLEPSTPVSTVEDVDDPVASEKKDRRAPAKKNRLHLEPTEEEGDETPFNARTPGRTGSPPLSTSPPYEMKVRQISQGVEDLSWRHKLMEVACQNIEVGSVAPETPGTAKVDITFDADQDAPLLPTGQLTPPPEPSKDADSSQSSTAPLNDADMLTPRRAVNGTVAASIAPRLEVASDDMDQDKVMKRKLSDRAPSQGPEEDAGSSGSESQKRARDDAEKDENPRETKRPSPPPDQPNNPAIETPTPKLSGFMSYAASVSPFAAVRGPSIFNSKSSSPFSGLSSANPLASSSLSAGESSQSAVLKNSSDTPSSTKRTGFEAFASSSSPFASIARSRSPSALGGGFHRSKSPTRRATPVTASAFSSYASGGAHAFMAPASKRARAGSPNGGSSRGSLERPRSTSVFGGDGDAGTENGDEDGAESEGAQTSFGARLRAVKDDDDDTRSEDDQPKVVLTEQELQTGEEDEDTIHQVRGKLFTLSNQNQWKERGTGVLRLNVRRTDGVGARLVMRKEAVYTVIVNITLFQGMKCFIAQDPRYLRFSAIESGVTTHYNLRLPNAKMASDLLEEINANIPSAL